MGEAQSCQGLSDLLNSQPLVAIQGGVRRQESGGPMKLVLTLMLLSCALGGSGGASACSFFVIGSAINAIATTAYLTLEPADTACGYVLNLTYPMIDNSVSVAAAHGTASISGQTIRYRREEGYRGKDTFTIAGTRTGSGNPFFMTVFVTAG